MDWDDYYQDDYLCDLCGLRYPAGDFIVPRQICRYCHKIMLEDIRRSKEAGEEEKREIMRQIQEKYLDRGFIL